MRVRAASDENIPEKSAWDQVSQQWPRALSENKQKLTLLFVPATCLILLAIVVLMLGGILALPDPFITEIRFVEPTPTLRKEQPVANTFREVITRQLFNKHNEGKVLGQDYKVQLGVVPTVKDGINLTELGMYDRIQVDSQYDFSNISSIVNFTQLEESMTNDLAYELITFNYNEKLEKDRKLLELKDFPDRDSLLKYLSGAEKQYVDERASSTANQQFYLGVLLSKFPDDPKVRQAEYMYYDYKYGIGQTKEEKPICIYASGYKIKTKNKYKEFFQSMMRQNYSNFHIVYIDDMSPDGSPQTVLDYLSDRNEWVNNRIKFVHNLQRVGTMGNMFFWVKKYCNDGDIVVHVDADDSLIGSQTLRVLNQVYSDPEVWYVYSRFVMNDYSKGSYFRDFNEKPVVSSKLYRVKEKVWFSSHLRTFRYRLMKLIKISQFVEYIYDSKTGVAYPHFYDHAGDRFEVYCQFELAGIDRVKHITDYLYLYDSTVSLAVQECYMMYEEIDEYKSRIKNTYQRMEHYGEPEARVTLNYKIPKYITNGIRRIQNELRDCLAKHTQ